MRSRWLALAALLVLGGCKQSVQGAGPVAPSQPPASVPAVAPAVPRADPVPQPAGQAPGVVVPAGALYVCVSERNGLRQQTVIEFEPKVLELCRRHPEMGPCQYEREACRRSGGHVFAANGQEITAATEAEYDKRVMRVQLRSN